MPLEELLLEAPSPDELLEAPSPDELLDELLERPPEELLLPPELLELSSSSGSPLDELLSSRVSLADGSASDEQP